MPTDNGIDVEDVRQACARDAEFGGGTAYQRTKICCRVLTERGVKIPNALELRSIIGAGSSTDINRGIKDFRKDHGAMLNRMAGIVPGIPPALQPSMSGLWEAAVAEAQAQLAVREQAYAEGLVQARERADEAVRKQLDGQERIVELQVELARLRERGTELEKSLAASRTAQTQLQGQLDRAHTELDVERRSIAEAVAANEVKVTALVTRMQGAEMYALSRIEDANKAHRDEIATVQANAVHQVKTMEQRLASADAAANHARTEAALSRQRAHTLEQQVLELQGRLAQAESQAKLQAKALLDDRAPPGGRRASRRAGADQPLRRIRR